MSARDAGLLDSCWVPRFRAHLGLSGLGFVLSLRAGCRWDEHQVLSTMLRSINPRPRSKRLCLSRRCSCEDLRFFRVYGFRVLKVHAIGVGGMRRVQAFQSRRLSDRHVPKGPGT